MRQGTPTISALSRSLAMLEAVLADREGRSVPAMAHGIGLPRATAHRQIATLVHEGFLVRIEGGRLAPGPRLIGLVGTVDVKQLIVSAAASTLHQLADSLQCLIQLGTLDNDMVTYRIKVGQGAGDLFTRVGMQLEAYCTGVGKVLLAHLPDREREAYLATGPFPALTGNTITDPAVLRRELVDIVASGFGRDMEEIAEGLVCVAVPVFDRSGHVVAAISASRQVADWATVSEPAVVRALQAAALQVGDRLGAGSAPI